MKSLMVLIVEDNDDTRKLYALVLARAGFEVKEAIDGKEAIEMLDQYEPDLLITDLQTPHLSGVDLISHVRSEKRWEELPIIAISAHSPDQLALAAIQGATRTLRKPLEPNRLLATVFELTKNRRARL
jgi:CheY-like chemotaxis protein